MTIREKVARAICLVFEGENRCPFGHEIPPGDEPYMEEGGFSITGKEIDEWEELTKRAATAAITAFLEAAAEDGWHMRRPTLVTREMKTVGDEARLEKRPATYIFRAMQAVAVEFELDK